MSVSATAARVSQSLKDVGLRTEIDPGKAVVKFGPKNAAEGGPKFTGSVDVRGLAWAVWDERRGAEVDGGIHQALSRVAGLAREHGASATFAIR